MGPVTTDVRQLDKAQFMQHFQDVYEHSPWLAEQLYDQRGALSPDDLKDAVAQALYRMVETADHETQLALLRAHPDLAGKAALAGELTQASKGEQAAAGLDQLTPPEMERFLALNLSYRDKFGFPFIMAVKNANKTDILAGFEARLPHDLKTEFRRALDEVHAIARFRLDALPDSLWRV